MRKITVWICLLSLGTSAIAVNSPGLKPAFADATWYANRAAVKQHMVKKGYTFVRDSNSMGATDSIYSGKLLGYPVEVHQVFNPKNQLVKTVVILQNTYSSNLYSDWSKIKSSLDNKYGVGLILDNVMESYRQNSTLLGIELDRGKKVSSFWEFDTYNYNIALLIDKAYANNEKYYVTLSYESPNWNAEFDRREQSNDL